VVWATHAAPTVSGSKTTDGSGTGAFTSSLTGLVRATTYHLRAYATSSAGTAYSAETTFTTKPLAPMVLTAPVTAIASTTAVSGGQVTSDGGSTILARGVVWSAHINPTTADSKTTNSLSGATYSSTLTNLTSGGEYHVRAYATNAIGTSYGADLQFTTLSPAGVPAVTTATAKLASASTATAGGNVIGANGKAITERGIVWAADKLPTINDSRLKATGTTGAFTVTLTGLKAKTAYYIRAYATNAAGTGYGSAVMVATLNGYGLPAAVSPLISSRWLDYTSPYNAYYPKLNGQQAQASCVPTALAKMLGYWKEPNGQGTLAGTDGAGYHWSVNLAKMNIDFSKVYDELSPNATQAQYDQTADVFLAAGAMAALHDVGGANISTDLYDELGYWAKLTPAVHVVHDWEYTADDWQHLVEYELAHGRPIMVSGGIPTDNDPWVGGGVTGHMWNVDGYDDQDRVHATYNYVDYSGTPIEGYFPVAAMGPVTTDGGQWPGNTHDHFSLMNFQPAVAATSSPVVETEPVNNPTSATARVSGSVIGQGNATVTKRGFHVSLVSGTSVKPYDVIVGSGEGHFLKTLTGLEPSTTYQVKAFATTITTTYYGEAQQFTTLDSGAVPAEVMPLIDSGWVFNTWPYNAALPAFPSGPGGHFYNEYNANALARLLYYWRYPTHGTGVFSNYVSWAGFTLEVDLSTLNLDYTKMPYKLKNTDTAPTYSQLTKLEAATEIFGFGATGTGTGAMRAAELDNTTAAQLASAWELDPGLRMVKQGAVSASEWASLLKAEIAAGRPVLVQGRTSDSVAPGKPGNVNSGWFLVDGYNAKGQFHADYSPVGLGGAPIAQGWYSPASLGPPGGFIAYNRAFIGFKPKE
ncbi:MAG: C10 family peptidase, partial [Terracidiphilus sp.]